MALHANNDSILIQSSERPRNLSMRLSAEEAAKAPLRPLQGSGDLAKRDNDSLLTSDKVRLLRFDSILLDFPRFCSILSTRNLRRRPD